LADEQFDRIAKRGGANHFDGFAFKQSQNGQTLDDGRVAGNFGDYRPMPDGKSIERHGLGGDRADEDLRFRTGTDAEFAVGDFQQAVASGLENFKPTALADTHFGHPPDPCRAAADRRNFGCLARLQHVEG
jgi:hypothetical protein